MRSPNRERGEAVKLAAISAWLLFTVAFALWWIQISLNHITALADLQPEAAEHWRRQLRMVYWEGGSWILLLVGGGAALIWLVLKEKRRMRQIREFFASFSHDVKTSLSSLRLQAESLADEWRGHHSEILDRLVGDTVRLQLQLENSLFLASQDDLNLFVESISLRDLVDRLREQWPTLTVRLKRDANLQGDERALRTVFSNLAKNAIVHGHASEVTVEATPARRGAVAVRFHDNGSGFEGGVEELGQLFHRPKATSGSGVGLYVSRALVEKMGGRMLWHAGNRGFRVDLELPGDVV